MENKSQSEWLLRKQLRQARREVSRAIAMKIVKIHRKGRGVINNPDGALSTIIEFEGKLNGA